MNKITRFSLIIFLIGVSFSIVHAVTTKYINTLGIDTYYFGLFFTMMSVGQVVGALVFSVIASKIKKKYLIIIGLIGYSLSQLGFCFINSNPNIILIFRFLAGFFASSANTMIIALAISEIEEEKRSKYLIILSAFSLLGSSCAYEIGGSLYSYLEFSITQVFLAQMLVCIFTSILTFVMFFNYEKEKTDVKIKNNLSFSNLKIVNSVVLVFFIALFLLNLGQITITKYIDVIVIDKGFNPSDLGHFTFIGGVVCCITNLILAPFVSKNAKTNKIYLIIIFSLLLSIASFVTFNCQNVSLMVMLYTVFMLFNIFKAIIIPLEQSYLTEITDKSIHTQMVGLRQSFISLGSIVGPLIGASVYESGKVLVFNVGSIIIVISSIVFFMVMLLNKSKRLQKTN